MNTKEPILSFNDMRNIYPVSKTIAFRLVPDSRTQAYVEKNDIIINAETLRDDRNTLKNAADRIHRRFIEETLSKLRLPYGMLQEYSDATEETDREKRTARLNELNAALKKHIATAFKDVKKDGKTGFLAALDGEELLKDLLPAAVNTDEEREALKRLQRYTTYLRPYMDARARIYSEDGGGNTIPNRIVDDNLPTVLANVKAFKLMPQDIRDGSMAIFDAVGPAWAQSIDEVFMLSYGCLLNAQSAIDAYNALIGGISAEDGSRIQGLNELVNLHNQQLPRDGQDRRLPKFRQLKKQILSEHETLSWVPQALQSDAEVMQVLDTIHEAYKGFNADSLLAVGEADPQKTYVRADRLAAFSKTAFLDWRKAADCIKSALRDQNPRKTREGEEGYEKRIEKLFKSRESFSLQEILDAVRTENPTADLTGLVAEIKELLAAAEVNHSRMLSKTGEPDGAEPLRQQKEDKDNARTAIRLWLDALIELCNIAAWFNTKDDAADKDPDCPDPQAEYRDYSNNTYHMDRGHMAPSADFTWSKSANEQTFYLTNICPQRHELNEGLWLELEQRCRSYAKLYKTTVHVVCGPVYDSAHLYIKGKNRVEIPDAFFKAILFIKDGKTYAAAFIIPNEPVDVQQDIFDYLVPLQAVTNQTGLIPFPDTKYLERGKAMPFDIAWKKPNKN